MIRWIFAALLLLLSLWAISLERSYAWLGLQSEQAQSFIAQGLHPLSFNFTDSAPVDVRWQLIGQRAQRAEIAVRAQGLWIMPSAESLELRLNLAGASLDPRAVSGLKLQMQLPEAANSQLALAVHEQANDAGWIAELPKNLTGDLPRDSVSSEQAIDLTTLTFLREPARTEATSWANLPRLRYLRLYAGTPTKTPFLLSQIGFQLAQPMSIVNISSMRPEALLAHFNALRNSDQSSWSTVHYRGTWLSTTQLQMMSGISLGIAMLLITFNLVGRPKNAPQSNRHGALTILQPLLPALITLTLMMPILALLWGYRYWPNALVELQSAPWSRLVLVLLLLLSYRAWTQLSLPALPTDSEANKYLIWQTAALPTLALCAILLIGFGWPNAQASLTLALKYLLFAALQQFLLQVFVLHSLRRAKLAKSVAITLSAFMFALWHTPNFTLMALCFCAGLFWSWHYMRHGKLLPLVLSHALLGWICSGVMPETLLRSANVGVGFFG
jgi:membrane protease YdiL (CAAX protease family)